MGEFTPGPWTVSFAQWSAGLPTRGFAVRAEGWAHSIASNNCSDAVNNEQFSPEELEANARLIAAAPELLEALKEIVETLRREAPGTSLNNHRFDALGAKALAAIAKAEGQS